MGNIDFIAINYWIILTYNIFWQVTQVTYINIIMIRMNRKLFI